MEIFFTEADNEDDEEANSPQFRISTRISYMNFSEINSSAISGLPIRVSKRNLLMRQKLNINENLLNVDREITSSYIAKVENDNIQKKEKNVSVLPVKIEYYKPYSCFLLFVIGSKGLRCTIAETELKYFRNSFIHMIEKNDACHEAFFGLGKLFAYIGDFEQSSKNLGKALKLKQDEDMYKVWYDLIYNYNKTDLRLKRDSILSNL